MAALPADFRVRNLYEPSFPDRSDQLRHALEQLHRERGLARVEFSLLGGFGLRTIQAKRAGLAFDDVELVVRVDACGPWLREREQRWPASFEEIEGEFAERYCFETADDRLTPDPAVLGFVRRQGWTVREPVDRSAPGVPLVTIGIAHFNGGHHLPDTLASIAAQTYPNLEVIIADDGSTDAASLAVFEQLTARYPRYRFLRGPHAGAGAARNRCLEHARGEFFLPVDADNLARPEMVARFVTAICRNPDLAAMTCYYLAFEDSPANPPVSYLHAIRPTGGPHVLSGIRNVYGDTNAILRTATFRQVGGFETDQPGVSCEDWEAFVKLARLGHRIGVVPDHLFDYRHLPGGFSRRTNWFANHQRVLRQFTGPAGEGNAVWAALVGFHLELQRLKCGRPPLRHRIIDALWAPVARTSRAIRRLLRRTRPTVLESHHEPDRTAPATAPAKPARPRDTVPAA